MENRKAKFGIFLFNKIDHLIQTRVDMPAIVSHRTDSDLCPLPEVVIPDFRDGHIKPVSHPVDQLPDYVPLPFQRVILRNSHVQLTDPYNHLLPLNNK